MNEFDKAELLRERANVSFEEARDALRACNGDLLDALVYLEKLGLAKNSDEPRRTQPDPAYTNPTPERERTYTRPDYSRSYDRSYDRGYDRGYDRDYDRYYDRSYEKRNEGPTFGQWLGGVIKKSMENFIVVSYDGFVKFRISVFAFVLLFLIFHGALLIAMGVSLFFGVKYSFSGKEDLSRVNRVLGDAGDRAERWWSSYRYNPEIDELCRKYDNADRNRRQ